MRNCPDFSQINWPDKYVDIAIMLIGAFVGFGSALLIYYEQNKNDLNSEKRKEEETHKHKLSYLKLILEAVLADLSKQLDEIDVFIEKQSKDFLSLQPLGIERLNNITRVKNLDNIGLFEAFEFYFQSSPDWLKNYQQMNKVLDYFEVVIKKVNEQYRQNFEDSFETLLRIRDNINHVPDFISGIAGTKIRELGEKRWEDEEYIFLNGTITQYRELVEKKAILQEYDEYLLSIIKSVFEKYSASYYAEELVLLCKKTRVMMGNVRSDGEKLNEGFSQHRGNSIEPRKKIQDIIELLGTI